jgi:hypothetical protein
MKRVESWVSIEVMVVVVIVMVVTVMVVVVVVMGTAKRGLQYR